MTMLELLEWYPGITMLEPGITMLELVINELGPVSLDRLGFKFLSTGGPGTAVDCEYNVSSGAGPEGGFLSGLRRLSTTGGG